MVTQKGIGWKIEALTLAQSARAAVQEEAERQLELNRARQRAALDKMVVLIGMVAPVIATDGDALYATADGLTVRCLRVLGAVPRGDFDLSAAVHCEHGFTRGGIGLGTYPFRHSFPDSGRLMLLTRIGEAILVLCESCPDCRDGACPDCGGVGAEDGCEVCGRRAVTA